MSILPFHSNCAEDDVRSKSPFLWQSTRLKSRRLDVLEYIHYRLFFTHAQLYVAFSLSISFGNVAVAIIEGHRQRIENDRLIA
jgi:hypothetical protein